MTLTAWIPEILAIFCKNYSLPSFLPCSCICFGYSCMISLTLLSALFLISVLSLWYSSTFYNSFWNSRDEMSPSCITCEMMSPKLSNLLEGSNLIASCISCFKVNTLKALRVTAIAREKSRPDLINVIPAGRSAPLANEAKIPLQ